MTKLQKNILRILGTLLLLAAGSAATGDRQLVLFSLGLIPFFFACWGLSYLLMGNRNREIVKNLTDDERDTVQKMSGDLGRHLGLFCVVPTVVLCGLLYFATNKSWLVAFVSFVACMVFSLPYCLKKRAKMRDFVRQTQWARENPETAE
jgi:hypothetical protein